MPTISDNKIDLLYKKFIGVPISNPSGAAASEQPGSSKSKIIPSLQIFSQNIPLTAPTDLSNVTFTPANSGGTKQISSGNIHIAKYTQLGLAEVQPQISYRYANPAVSTNLTSPAIPGNYDVAGSTYAITLYGSDGTTVINPSIYPWVFDTDSGYVTFIDTANLLPTSLAPPKITFWRYEGTFGLGGSGESSGAVTGDLSSNGNLFIAYDTSLNGNLRIGKDLTINGRLNVQNYTNTNIINTTVNNYQLIISEDISLNGRLLVSRDSSMNGNLFVAYDTSLNSRLVVGSDVTMNQRLFTVGAASFSGNLYVGATTASSSYSTGALVVNGGAGMNGSIYFPNNGAGLVWGSNFSQIMDDADLKIMTDDTMRFFTANTQRMMINSAGRVGINNTTPVYPLHVGGSGAALTQSYRYFTVGTSTPLTGLTSASPTPGIYSGGAIIALGGFYASSDKRIKYNIYDFADIPIKEILRLLKPRIYNYIDEVINGYQPVWGFIAQEVAEIIPNAVTYSPDYIPNIYEVAEIIGKEIKLGNKITTDLLKDENGYYSLKIKSTNREDKIVNITGIIDEKTFKIDQEIETDHNKVFVYGQEVPDFHSLNKDQIFTITTAVVQEIDKELQETKNRVQLLEEENQNLKQQIIDITELLGRLSEEVKEIRTELASYKQ